MTKQMIDVCPHISNKPWEKPWGKWRHKTENMWLKRIWRRVYARNQNWLCICYGDPGTGKSYTGMSLCEMLDPNFSVDKIVFDAKELLELIEKGGVQQGSAILFEELGVAANTRDWYSQENKALSNLTQVFRTLNLIVIYTVPRLGLVDKHIAPLAHAHLRACGIDYAKNQNRAIIYDPVTFNEKRNNWSLRHPEYKRNGVTVKLRLLRINKVSPKIWKPYEKKRAIYLSSLRKKAFENIEQGQQLRKRTHLTDSRLSEIVNEIVSNKEKYVIQDDTKFDRSAVMRDFGVGNANATRIKEEATKRFKELNFHVIYR